MKRIVLLIVALALVAGVLIGCAETPTATPVPPTKAPASSAASSSASSVASSVAPAPTKAPEPTKAPASSSASSVASSSAASSSAAPTPTSVRAAIGTSGCHLILSTTTSTADSGLLTFILPDFEKKFNCKVDVVAVGTGQAIALGQKGDADVLLVHDRVAEDKFVADKNTLERLDVMYNDFIIVGPKNDPAKISGMKTAKDAYKAIMDTKSTFASRGDKSGTNTKELAVWATLGITPTKELSWYNALGQGMGDTLLFANEKGAYTLTDRATWLAQQAKLTGLVVLVGGANINQNADKELFNPYGVMAVNATKFTGINSTMANNFAKWITSVEIQKVINTFGVDKYGQQLFYASSAEYLKSLPTSSGASSSTGAASSDVILTIAGLVGKETKYTMAQLQALNPVTLNAEHPKNGAQTNTGVRLNALLDAAQLKAEATKLILTADDGFVGEVAVADVKKCADCLMGFNNEGKVKTVMPGMASNLWIKNVIKIEAK